jgi:hypothetical protein
VSNWLVDPKVFNLDCGDNSCRYVTNKTGMRTNGGCRCALNHGDKVERFLNRNYHAAQQRIKELENSLEFSRSLEQPSDDGDY